MRLIQFMFTLCFTKTSFCIQLTKPLLSAVFIMTALLILQEPFCLKNKNSLRTVIEPTTSATMLFVTKPNQISSNPCRVRHVKRRIS